MTGMDLLAYVRTTAAALALPLDATQAARVADHLARSAEMAAVLDAVALATHDELVEIFCPAPWIEDEIGLLPAPSGHEPL